jgi:NADPH2:quinone reductase
MRAVRFHIHGGPGVLALEHVPVPIPATGEVLLRMTACGINYADTVRRNGDHYPQPTPLPFTLGAEILGQIVALGAGVESWQIGQDAIAVASGGGYAEYATVEACNLFPVPEGIDPIAAVALFVQGLSAALILKDVARLRPGETVFIEGGSGGVGTFAVQLAKIYGARQVIAGVGGLGKCELARRLGADLAIDYTAPGWSSALLTATGGRGVDLILEMAGGAVFEEAIGTLAEFGRMVVYGAASRSAQTLRIPPLLPKNQTITGFYIMSFLKQRDLIMSTLAELAGYVREGRLALLVGGEFSLERAADAHRLLEARQTSGKLVLRL